MVLELDDFSFTSCGEVYKECTLVLQSAVSKTLEMKWCLNRRVAYHARCSGKLLTIEMESLDEEIGVVETRNGKPRKGVHHIGMEIPPVFEIDSIGLRRQGIHIERCRDIGVETVEIIELMTGV